MHVNWYKFTIVLDLFYILLLLCVSFIMSVFCLDCTQVKDGLCMCCFKDDESKLW